MKGKRNLQARTSPPSVYNRMRKAQLGHHGRDNTNGYKSGLPIALFRLFTAKVGGSQASMIRGMLTSCWCQAAGANGGTLGDARASAMLDGDCGDHASAGGVLLGGFGQPPSAHLRNRQA